MTHAIRSRRVVAGGRVGEAAVVIEGQRIVSVVHPDTLPAGLPTEDLGDLVLSPGLVDTHVHVNEPGRTEWEGFASATAAAASGGVTTLVDMPLNSIPPTTTVAGLDAKRAAAEGQLRVDVGACGGLLPTNFGEIAPLRAAGVLAFKCFLAPSGVDEFPHVDAASLAAGMRAVADAGAILLVHAELPAPLAEAERALPADISRRAYAAWLRSRPAAAEVEAAELLARHCAELRGPVHVVHLSAAEALVPLRRARDAGLPFSAETCPHYLHFAAERILDGATAFKCAPPIRSEANRGSLWAALGEGLLDQVVTDHSPSTGALKCTDTGDFLAAWGGIAGLQLGLAATWTGASARGHGVVELARWMSEAPARRVGLWGRKGAIAPGFDADLFAWDAEAWKEVDLAELRHKNPLTPYRGERLRGVVRRTWLRGRPIFAAGTLLGPPSGAWVVA